MLDINLIRKNPEIVKENLKKRFQDNRIKILNEILKKDKEFLNLKREIESLRHKKNEISIRINELKKQKKPAAKEIKEALSEYQAKKSTINYTSTGSIGIF